MMGTMFCQYETPCGWGARLNKECPEKDCSRLKRNVKRESAEKAEKLLSPVGEYAVKFAENHGISTSEAMSHPMVRAHENVQAQLKSGI